MAKFEVKETASGKFMFNLKAGNGQVILTSELYEARSGAVNSAESVKENAGNPARYDRRSVHCGATLLRVKGG